MSREVVQVEDEDGTGRRLLVRGPWGLVLTVQPRAEDEGEDDATVRAILAGTEIAVRRWLRAVRSRG